jgi:ABC-2 type transport system permease protein
MKLISVFIKSLKEQIRSFWILLLTLSMGPFFIFVYFLILESSKPHYNVVIINNDKGYQNQQANVNEGEKFISFFRISVKDSANMPFFVKGADDKQSEIEFLKNKKTDALIIIPENFSEQMSNYKTSDTNNPVNIEFIGDLTNVNYLISATWASGLLNEFARINTDSKNLIKIVETALGSSSNISDFDLIVPGILILSLIMLMFTATIAFISEVENKTIIRLKLSKLTSFEFIAGVSLVQFLVGIISIFATLGIAVLLGFSFKGPLPAFFLITILTSLSIIAFSLIIAALTKTANEVLVVGNFPLFLFMFFTGAAFPLRSEGFFTLFGYPVSFQGLMSPTHAIASLNKILIMQMSLRDIMPEITALIIVTIIYFVTGMILFRRRHMVLK